MLFQSISRSSSSSSSSPTIRSVHSEWMVQRLVVNVVVVTMLMMIPSVMTITVPNPPQHDRRPNILLLLTDDQDLLLGGTEHMPFFDQHLTQQGTTFQNFFVHTPICCPSRASILTGQYLHNNGVLNNTGEGNCDGAKWQEQGEHETFAIYAQQAGYHTGYAGKYMNMYGESNVEQFYRIPPGWNQWLAMGLSGYYDYTIVQSDDGVHAERIRHGNRYDIDYFPDVVANRTIRMIQDFSTQLLADDDGQSSTTIAPFLIVTAWPTPHGPFVPAPWARDLFNGTIAPRTPNWNASDEFMQQKHWIMRQQSPIDALSEQNIDNTYLKRLQSLQSVDQHIDQFIRVLEDLDILDNTIIMYTSDNGFQSGQHRLCGDKRHLYDHDVRVPFVIRGPSIAKNVSLFHHVAGNIDIAPTIYQIINSSGIYGDGNASLPLPHTMDGVSMLPIPYPESTVVKRHDMLISYFGEGYHPCGLLGCPAPPPQDFHTIDGTNNTFHCIRSVVHPSTTSSNSNNTSTIWKNFTFCRFKDDENFGEFYDHTTDPWQLHNKFLQLSNNERYVLDHRLTQLRSCRGNACRVPWPELASLFEPVAPSVAPTTAPTKAPTTGPTTAPTVGPTTAPTVGPTTAPTVGPTTAPTTGPTPLPTISPSFQPTLLPSTITPEPTSLPLSVKTTTTTTTTTAPFTFTNDSSTNSPSTRHAKTSLSQENAISSSPRHCHVQLTIWALSLMSWALSNLVGIH